MICDKLNVARALSAVRGNICPAFDMMYGGHCWLPPRQAGRGNNPLRARAESRFRREGSKYTVPGPQTKRRPEKGGKLNTSQAGSVVASKAAVGQFLSISREAFILRTRYILFSQRLFQLSSPHVSLIEGHQTKYFS